MSCPRSQMRMPPPQPMMMDEEVEHPRVRKSKRQTMMAVTILAILLIAVTLVEPYQEYSDNALLRTAATYKHQMCLVLSVIILLIVARHYNIARQYTNWIPMINEYYAAASGMKCLSNSDCTSNVCQPSKTCQ